MKGHVGDVSEIAFEKCLTAARTVVIAICVCVRRWLWWWGEVQWFQSHRHRHSYSHSHSHSHSRSRSRSHITVTSTISVVISHVNVMSMRLSCVCEGWLCVSMWERERELCYTYQRCEWGASQAQRQLGSVRISIEQTAQFRRTHVSSERNGYSFSYAYIWHNKHTYLCKNRRNSRWVV